jgi:hypothetical protein
MQLGGGCAQEKVEQRQEDLAGDRRGGDCAVIIDVTILNQVLRKLNLALIGGQEKEHKQYVAQGVDLTGAMNSAMQEQAY